MPWTETTRPQYQRDDLRYSSDLTDEEWAAVAPFMPEPNRIGRGYSGDKLKGALVDIGDWTLEIVKKVPHRNRCNLRCPERREA